jgi:hypothetical protein
MKIPVAHWGARDWRRNMDDLVPDPERPQAFPSTYPMDLMGRIRVRLTAEDGNLVAYGFGGQRIVMPAKSVGGVYTVTKFRFWRGVTHGRALIVLDRENRVLLRADGLWETYGEVSKVCGAAKIDRAVHLYPGSWRKYQYLSQAAGRTTAGRSTPKGNRVAAAPQFEKAPQYRRLRTRPRGWALRVLALMALYGLTLSFGGFLGALPAQSLPIWFGAVRTLLGIIGVILGLAAGLWGGAAVTHVWVDALRWAGASLTVGGPAPVRRFFGRRRGHAEAWLAAANVGLVALFVALLGWGPGVGLSSLVDGFRDSSLVASLRANGVTTQGALIDVPQYGTDNNGNPTVTDVATLTFKVDGQTQQATDPSIGGRPLPLDADDPAGTQVPETIVYLPDNPQVAAARQQIAGSVWHGAPTANLISGGIFTLALPPLFLYLVLRARRLRWRRAKDLVEDLSA